MEAQKKFEAIHNLMVSQYEEVSTGNMMKSPAITYRGKVFAFLWKERMGFRLGPADPEETYDISNWEPLSPFKTKPPLKGWYMVPVQESGLWMQMAEDALEYMKSTTPQPPSSQDGGVN